jgi:tRNA(Arg) A34 adenosine deaminase TadA
LSFQFLYLKLEQAVLITTTSRKTRRYFELARNLALKSSYGKIKHGAILVKGGNVFSGSPNKENYNAFGSRFRHPDRGPATLHAELGCILGMSRNVTQGATVYVARVSTTGEFRMSKPCEMCHAALKHVGIRRVIYTKNSEEIESYKL